ncbi:brefeldin A-inhibited guanine nucleotide-exchange protein 5, partial [Tanacetum coccineum]
CLVSVLKIEILKSLVDWEKLRRESKQNEEQNSIEENSSAAESQGNFEKVKAHKSTMEAAISEFNCHPVKGIEFLKSNSLVENTPECQLLTFSETCLAWTSIGAEEDSFGKDEIAAVHTRYYMQKFDLHLSLIIV